MPQDLQSHILSVIISLLVGIVVFYLSKFVTAGSPESVGLAIVAGIGVHLVFDRVAYRKKIDHTKQDIIESLRVGTPFEAGYRILKNEDEAMDYLNSVLPSAKSAWNTRLDNQKGFYGISFLKRMNAHDSQLMEIVERGGELRFVFEKENDEAPATILRERYSELKDKRATGTMGLYFVDFGYTPVLQMIIIEGNDGLSEALVGWSLGNEKSFSYQVALFRDPPIVQFFRSVFEEYTKYDSSTLN